MKKTALVILAIMLTSMIGLAQDKLIKHVPFFPLAVGNYWVFSNSKHPDKPDTIRIEKIRIINSDTAFYYDGGLILERNDSIFEFQRGPTDPKLFPILEYFPSEKEVEFNLKRGDILGRRTVSKIKGAYKLNGKEYFDCYKFYAQCGKPETTIICRGIGIIETEKYGIKRTLLNYSIQ